MIKGDKQLTNSAKALKDKQKTASTKMVPRKRLQPSAENFLGKTDPTHHLNLTLPIPQTLMESASDLQETHQDNCQRQGQDQGQSQGEDKYDIEGHITQSKMQNGAHAERGSHKVKVERVLSKNQPEKKGKTIRENAKPEPFQSSKNNQVLKKQKSQKVLNPNLNSPKTVSKKKKVFKKPDEWLSLEAEHKELLSMCQSLSRQLEAQNQSTQKYSLEKQQLKKDNLDLIKKVERYKAVNEENKKQLKHQISAFNEEGMELIKNRNQIVTLQQKLQQFQEEMAKLSQQNESLENQIHQNQNKDELSKFSPKQQKQRLMDPTHFAGLTSEILTDSINYSSIANENIQSPENQSFCNMIDEYPIKEHYFDKSVIFEKKSTAYQKDELLIQAKNQFEGTLKFIEESYEQRIQIYQAKIQQQAQIIDELQMALEMAKSRQNDVSNEEKLTIASDPVYLNLLHKQASKQIDFQLKLKENAQFKQILLAKEIQTERLLHQRQMRLKKVASVPDDNELFQIHLMQLSLTSQLESAKQKLESEFRMNCILKEQNMKKEELIKKFSAKKKDKSYY